MPKEMVVLGPPGTGKTRFCTDTAKRWFDSGVSTDQVAYLAFTKAAAREAASRVLDDDFKKDFGEQLPYFRTIHSLAYMGLRRAKPDIRLVTTADMKGFSKWSSMDGKYAVAEWEDMAEHYQRLQKRGKAEDTEWDDCLNAYNLSRISARNEDDLKAASIQMSNVACNAMGRLDSSRYQSFVAKYETYKDVNGLVDFTDMLEFALTKMEPLRDVKHVVVDECFPAGTKITMADGSKKEIQEIGLGDIVLGVDHRIGTIKGARVVEKRSRQAFKLVEINGYLTLTSNHPVFVIGKGYVESSKLRLGDKIFRCRFVGNNLRDMRVEEKTSKNCGPDGADNLLSQMRREKEVAGEPCLCEMQKMRQRIFQGAHLQEEVLFGNMSKSGEKRIGEVEASKLDMRDLRQKKNIHANINCARQEILQRKVLACSDEIEDKASVHGGSWTEKKEAVSRDMQDVREGQDFYRKAEREAQDVLQSEVCGPKQILKERARGTLGAYEEEKPDEAKGLSGQDERDAYCDIAQTYIQKGEWHGSYGPAADSFGKAWGRVDTGASNRNRSQKLESCCPGHSERICKDCGGVRRGFTLHEKAEEHRQKKNADPGFFGMEDSEIFEQVDYEQLGFCCWVDTVRSVEPVEAAVLVYNIGTESENYFAEDTLVHNCQDLAPILHTISDRLFQDAEEIWHAGDDDQSIFKFSAADASLFIERARRATRIFLRQTHRFGDDIVKLSHEIISRVSDRVKKEVIGAKGKEHLIQMTGSFQPQAFGDMLLLHRHVAGCQALGEAYIHAGVPFRNERGRDPLGAHARMLGYKALRDLSDGKMVSPGAVTRLVDDLMPSMVIDERKGTGNQKTRLIVHGAKKKMQNFGNSGDMNLMDCMRAGILTNDGADVIRQKFFNVFKHSDDLEYYDRVVDNGYDLEGKHPVITTIHGSKGREAGKVVVFSEMGMKCWDDKDTEHRLAYVAATRTQRELEVCAESTLSWPRVTHYSYPISLEKRGAGVTPLVTHEE